MSGQHDIQDPKLSDYFQGCLYFTLSRLQRNINRMAEEAFKDMGLAPSQAFLLMALNESDSLTASQLSEICGLTPSTITRFIDKLEHLGLCQRTYEGKTTRLSITKKGARLVPDFQKAWKTLFDHYNEVYGQREAEKLNNLVASLNNKTRSK